MLPEGGEGAAVAVAVTPGISDGRMTEIIAGDLEVGMQVITDQKNGRREMSAPPELDQRRTGC